MINTEVVVYITTIEDGEMISVTAKWGLELSPEGLTSDFTQALVQSVDALIKERDPKMHSTVMVDSNLKP